jgi:hypothetical protein
MGKLNWRYSSDDKHCYAIAVAENGMTAVIVAEDEVFLFPLTFVEYNGLRKVSKTMFADRESAEKWCEEEVEQWIVVPK